MTAEVCGATIVEPPSRPSVGGKLSKEEEPLLKYIFGILATKPIFIGTD